MVFFSNTNLEKSFDLVLAFKISNFRFQWLRQAKKRFINHRKQSFPMVNRLNFGLVNHRKSEFPEKNAFAKNQFSQPWNIRFAHSNSRFLTTDHKISSDAIRFGFEAREDSQNHPARSDVRKCFAKLLQGNKLMFLPRSGFFESEWFEIDSNG